MTSGDGSYLHCGADLERCSTIPNTVYTFDSLLGGALSAYSADTIRVTNPLFFPLDSFTIPDGVEEDYIFPGDSWKVNVSIQVEGTNSSWEMSESWIPPFDVLIEPEKESYDYYEVINFTSALRLYEVEKASECTMNVVSGLLYTNLSNATSGDVIINDSNQSIIRIIGCQDEESTIVLSFCDENTTIPVTFPSCSLGFAHYFHVDDDCPAGLTNYTIHGDMEVAEVSLFQKYDNASFNPSNVNFSRNEDSSEDISISCTYPGEEFEVFGTYDLEVSPLTPTTTFEWIHPLILLQNETISVTAGVVDLNLNTINATFRLHVDDVVIENKTDINIPSGGNGTATFDYTLLSPGDSVKVGIILSDIEGTSEEFFTEELVVRATNQVPEATARIHPVNFVGADDEVDGYCTGTDAEGDTMNYLYKWLVNGMEVKNGSLVYSSYFGYTSGVEVFVDTLESSYLSQGDVLTLSCSAYDAKNASDYGNVSINIFSENDFAPVMKSATIVPFGHQDTTISFNISANSSDYDSSTVIYEWRFVKNGQYQVITTTGTLSSGVEHLLDVLSDDETQAGDEYYVRVRAYDGVSYSGWMASNVVYVDNTIPVMVSANITSEPYENVTLQASCNATDIDTEQTITYEYLWYRNGSYAMSGSHVNTNETQEGETWIVGCRAFDGENYSLQMNSSSAVIIGTENFPEIDILTLQAKNTQATGVCKIDDADGDPIDYVFGWYVDGVLNETQTLLSQKPGVAKTSTFNRTFSAGETILFDCFGKDNQQGNVSENASLTVPSIQFNYVVSDVSITSITVRWTTNADQVKVYLDDVLQTTTNLIEWRFEDLVPNTNYVMKLIPVKENFTGNEYIFNETTPFSDNNNPVMQEVSFVPGEVYTEDSITGRCRATDVEHPNLFYTYTWKVNNITVSSGVTSLYPKNTNVVVGSLTSSNYIFNDTITLGCTAYDGIGSSSEMIGTIIVQNTEPVIEEELIQIELLDSDYFCDHTYSDADGDEEINQTFDWFINDVLNQSGYSPRLPIQGTFTGDELICRINTGDAYHNITKNSSVFTVGDFELPVVENFEYPLSAFTDTEVLVTVKCTDNVGVANGYPKIRFINPNYVEQEYSFFYEGTMVGDDPATQYNYARYIKFNIAGVYTNFEVECKDGNSNMAIDKNDLTLFSKIREQTITIGGSGSGTYCGDGICNGNENQDTCPEDCGERPDAFEVIADITGVSLKPGETRIVEFEVRNKADEDITFTTAILVTEDIEAYEWMEFEGGVRAFSFKIEKASGLASDNKYIRYYIRVPEDAEIGTYKGLIEINGLEQTKQYRIDISVDEGISLLGFFSFFDYPLFEIPFTTDSSITGQVIKDPSDGEDVPGIPFTVFHLTLTMGVVGAGIFGYRRLVGV